jgi:hypothetical protein
MVAVPSGLTSQSTLSKNNNNNKIKKGNFSSAQCYVCSTEEDGGCKQYDPSLITPLVVLIK